jgi:hypothetical protein
MLAFVRSMSALAVLAALALLLGCGGGDDDEAKTVKGTDYEYELPQGWEDATDMGKNPSWRGRVWDSVAIGHPDEQFRTFIQVTREPTGLGLEGYEQRARGQAQQIWGGLDFGEARPAEIDGARALEFENTTGETSIVRYIATVREGVGYIVEFEAAKKNEPDVEELEGVLDSWRWK